MTVLFRVARNPDPGSRLAYLLWVPVPDGPLLLKARERWPRTAKVYCHRADAWPDVDGLELVEEVAVRTCAWRGRSVDLVLDRHRENRSQFVFTRLKSGREGIFWQTPKTVGGVRPGLRVPTRRASGAEVLTVLRDTRERYGYRFANQQAVVDAQPLPCGDYGIAIDGRIVAAVERKSLDDFSTSAVDASLSFAMAELAALERAAVVVEGRYGDLFTREHVQPGFLADLVAQLQVRYPTVPNVFCGSRKLAEEWTFRFLGAARAELS
ncbi:ERCC4 domain-containing protein [Egicoccus sp. AB-alg6-2]|uniref:ERCC4 domain-containing protein n=1 Tax=Egicoccus sp. AB-alg6-2 TaxID=3242692 RepID=UPI00359DD5F7